MAKKKPAAGNGEESVSGYFRKLFEANPKLLDERSNDALLQKWLEDHPGQTEVSKSVKTGLANIKSVMRSKGRKKTARRAEGNQTIEPGMKARVGREPSGTSKLEALEHQIDECIIEARVHDREGLASVIDHLRRARNQVVWQMGQ